MTTKNLIYIDGKAEWIEVNNYLTGVSKRNIPKNDPTIDQYIRDNGGIRSHLDNKVYTNKQDYLRLNQKLVSQIHGKAEQSV